jgi:hypothetical protein
VYAVVVVAGAPFAPGLVVATGFPSGSVAVTNPVPVAEFMQSLAAGVRQYQRVVSRPMGSVTEVTSPVSEAPL